MALSGVALGLVALLLAIRFLPGRSGGGDTVRLRFAKELPAWRPGPSWASAVPPQTRPGEALKIPRYPPWTPEQCEALFRLSENEVADPFSGKVWKPGLRFSFYFPEYPGTELEFIINSLSMREDSEPRLEKPLLRVLVAGDSHTDGVCANAESFPNLCEQALRLQAKAESDQRGQSFDPTSIEVLNAGKGSHSFFNYLGTLERHLELKPDVFVVAVYGGNDFDEVLSTWHFYFSAGRRPTGAVNYSKEVTEAVEICLPAMSQALNSVKYFDHNPDQKDLAVQAGLEVFHEIQAICRERGIRLIVLYLPPRPDIEPQNPDVKLRKLLKALKLEASALASTNEMADKLLARLTESGIETLDMRPRFLSAPVSLYWSMDWHINLAGHQLVARTLIKSLSARN